MWPMKKRQAQNNERMKCARKLQFDNRHRRMAKLHFMLKMPVAFQGREPQGCPFNCLIVPHTTYAAAISSVNSEFSLSRLSAGVPHILKQGCQ